MDWATLLAERPGYFTTWFLCKATQPYLFTVDHKVLALNKDIWEYHGFIYRTFSSGVSTGKYSSNGNKEYTILTLRVSFVYIFTYFSYYNNMKQRFDCATLSKLSLDEC